MNTPTPRTDTATYPADCLGKTLVTNRDLARTLERELTAERARLDWLMAGGVCMIQHTGGFHVSRLHAPVSRAAIDAAMKEHAK